MKIPKLRLLVATLIAAYLIGAPFYRQVLGGTSPWHRNWIMFSGIGLDLCQVRYLIPENGRGYTSVDRLEALGHTRWTAPRRIKWLRSERDVLRQGRQVCRALEVRDLRAHARCATRRGWEVVEARERNLCLPGRRR